MFLLTFFLPFALLILAVVGQGPTGTVVTVNYTDPRITFSGTWGLLRDANCVWTATSVVGGTASFRFRGVGIKIFGDYVLTTTPVVRLDGVQHPVIPGVNGPACDELLFEQAGLADTEHTVELILSRSTGGTVDLSSFIYTEAPVPVTTSSSTQASTQTQTTAPTQSPVQAGDSASQPHNRLGPGAIAGIVVGAVAAAVLAVLAFLGSDQIAHVLESMLFGFFAWKSRRLIFKAPKSLGQTQIALFLTNGDIPIEINDEDAEKPVVWQVFNIGGAQREFMVEIPAVPGTGDVKLGFATIDEKESDVTVVQCRTAERAPARLIDENAWEHGDDDTDAATPVKVDPKARPKLTARNTSGFKTRIALGTYHEEEEKVRPLLLVEQFRGDEVYVAKDDLYLHAFRTNGYTSGQYGKAIVKDVIGDRLTESGGIRLSKLSPLTSWYIKSDSSGRLTVKIGRNSRKDVKAYRHECKIGKDVTKPVLV